MVLMALRRALTRLPEHVQTMKVHSARFHAGPIIHHRESMLVISCELEGLARAAGQASGPCFGTVPEALQELQQLWIEAADWQTLA